MQGNKELNILNFKIEESRVQSLKVYFSSKTINLLDYYFLFINKFQKKLLLKIFQFW